MREHITPSEYSELTDAYNSVFDGVPLETPSLVEKRGIISSILFGKEYESSRDANVTWIEENTPGSVPREFESYQRVKGVSESKQKTIYPFRQIGRNTHKFTLHNGPMMGEDYQLSREFNQTLFIDLETMVAWQLDRGIVSVSDPIAIFCRQAISHINEMNERKY